MELSEPHVGQPKIVLDTNVAGKLNEPAYRADAGRIISVICTEFKILVSPLTFYELLDTIQGGDGSHFGSDRELFKWMVGREFLRLPGAFALRGLLGLDCPATKFGPADFRDCLDVLLRAKSREDLFSGNVQTLHRGKWRFGGMQPQVIRQQHRFGQRQHRERLESSRDAKIPCQPPVAWAFGYARLLGHKITEVQAQHFASGLDAVYEYDKILSRLVADGSYNFGKHQGDWIDMQQLHYLCDSDIHLLTDDRKLKSRVEHSSQSARVFDFREFLEGHGFTPKH
jgi:hypothetical protein